MLAYSLAHGLTLTPLIERTIGDVFGAAVEKWPAREAVVSRHERERYSYRALQVEVNRLASALLNLGLLPGDRIGIWSHNNIAWLLMQLATAKASIILVNINPAYRVSELEYALNKSGCKAIVTMRRYKSSDYLDMLLQIAPELKDGSGSAPAGLPSLRHVVWIDSSAQETDDPFDRCPRVQRFSQLLATGLVDDERLVQLSKSIQPVDFINIQFTSGTTGSPKGATLTHRNVVNNGFFVGERMKLTHEDRLCIPVPLYHCFGMVMGNLACLTHGSTIVYPNDGFDALTVLEAVQEERCTALHGVPTMFAAELDHPRFDEFDLSTLRTGVMAGAPCPIALMKRVVEKMHLSEITIAYGMTETGPVSCQSTIDTPLDKRVSTVGTVHDHLEVKIIDASTGETVPPGVQGEICTRGYSVMRGYWDDEVKTHEAVDREGWMHTGDLGTMNADGYVNVAEEFAKFRSPELGPEANFDGAEPDRGECHSGRYGAKAQRGGDELLSSPVPESDIAPRDGPASARLVLCWRSDRHRLGYRHVQRMAEKIPYSEAVDSCDPGTICDFGECGLGGEQL